MSMGSDGPVDGRRPNVDETTLEQDLDLILAARPDPLDLLDLDAYSPEPEDEPEDEEVGTSAADEAEDDEED
jgi:hypothetical protein